MIQAIAISVSLFLIILTFGLISSPRWNVLPKYEYHKIVKLFGEPSYMITIPHGIAVWNDFVKDCPLHRIMVVDSDKCNANFVQITIKYTIDNKDIDKVNSLELIKYDNLNQELTSKCGSFENSIAMLVFADKLIKGEKYSVDIHKKYLLNSKQMLGENYTMLRTINESFSLRN